MVHLEMMKIYIRRSNIKLQLSWLLCISLASHPCSKQFDTAYRGHRLLTWAPSTLPVLFPNTYATNTLKLIAQPNHSQQLNSITAHSIRPRRQDQWYILHVWTYLFSQLANPLYNTLPLIRPILN